MTSKEYVIWLKGFVEACHEYAPTPKQWDSLKDKLAEVNDNEPIIINNPTLPPYPIIKNPPYIDPYNPYKITCEPNGTAPSPHFVIPSTPGITFSTTPGSGIGTITTPNGTLAYDTSTTTRWNPSGSSWHYTNSTIGKKIEKEEHPEKHHNED